MKSLGKLFSSLTTKSNDTSRVVGVDVGSSSIKVVELQEQNGILNLTTYGELQLGPYADQEVGQSVLLSEKREQQALVDILRESAVKAKNAVFAMPLSSSFVTIVNLTTKSDEDISSRIRVEARKYIPVPIGEVTLDWAEIGLTDGESGTKHDVLVAAIQNKALSRFKVLMQFVNLKEPPTEIECFSSIRGAYREKEENIAIIDIGAVSTKLYIAKNGLLQRMHRVRAGGAIATKRIASALELSFEDAEIAKRSITKDDKTFRDMQRAHHSCYERAWEEFGLFIKEYEKITSLKLDMIYLSGGGSIFPTTKLSIENALQRKIANVNTFDKVAYPAFMEDIITELGPTFHVALGAALRVYE
jgi:type IV pilus assembly protein PilM